MPQEIGGEGSEILPLCRNRDALAKEERSRMTSLRIRLNQGWRDTAPKGYIHEKKTYRSLWEHLPYCACPCAGKLLRLRAICNNAYTGCGCSGNGARAHHGVCP